MGAKRRRRSQKEIADEKRQRQLRMELIRRLLNRYYHCEELSEKEMQIISPFLTGKVLYPAELLCIANIRRAVDELLDGKREQRELVFSAPAS